jgi:DNA-binding transcriptional regulator YiaG
MNASTGIDELLADVRSKRKLPPANERQQIRKAAKVSLRDMAKALGVSHSLIRHWESGGTPREPYRAAYAELLIRLRG